MSVWLAAAAFVLVATPLDVQAQKVWRVAIVEPYAAGDPINDLIRQLLREVGYTEGRNITVDWRFGAGQVERFPAFAAEVTRQKPDAIVAVGEPAIRAVRQATSTIPVIAGSDDLVGEGHVATLARPGRNVTGVSILSSELNAKRLELLKQAVPNASRISLLWDPATGTFHLPSTQRVAGTLRIELKVHEVRSEGDLARAFAEAKAWRAEAVNVLASPLLHSIRHAIIDHAARSGLPAMYQWEESAKAGGLMSYGPIRADVYRALFVQLDRVLKGARPGELPVVQPTKFELVVNLKTARVLGLTVPPALLAHADRVIE